MTYERDEKNGSLKPTAAIPAPNAAIAAVIEKKSMINLVQGFSVAVKHLLRGEPGIYYEDLYPLVCYLPRYSGSSTSEADLMPLWKASEMTVHPNTRTNTRANTRANSPVLSELPQTHSEPELSQTAHGSEGRPNASRRSSMFGTLGGRSTKRKETFDPEKVLPQVLSERPLKPARNPPKTTLYDFLPFLRIFKPIVNLVTRKNADLDDTARRSLLGHKKYIAHVESNVPLEITLFLSSYLAWLLKKGLLTPAIATALTNNIQILQDCSVNLQRIRNTPLPFAYQAHLRMSLWLYLIFLPFQIYTQMQWLTIPATAFASFLLVGFLEIGQEM